MSASARERLSDGDPGDTVFRRIVFEMADAVVSVDSRHLIRFLNPAAETLFGWHGHELIGRPLNTIIPERFHRHHGVHMRHFRDEGTDARYMGNRKGFILGLNRKGEEIRLGATILHIREGGSGLMIAVIRDLTERLDHQNELQRLADTDPLSGVLNRRAFREIAEREIRNAGLRAAPAALILVDIDHFKRINDRYGHDAGDRVICDFTDVMRAALRTRDIMARWGGEEFIVLLPAATLERAAAVAERIRRTVEIFDFAVDTGTTLRLTASAGVSGNARGATLENMIRRADRALYAAKAGGRNRIFVDGG